MHRTRPQGAHFLLFTKTDFTSLNATTMFKTKTLTKIADTNSQPLPELATIKVFIKGVTHRSVVSSTSSNWTSDMTSTRGTCNACANGTATSRTARTWQAGDLINIVNRTRSFPHVVVISVSKKQNASRGPKNAKFEEHWFFLVFFFFSFFVEFKSSSGMCALSSLPCSELQLRRSAGHLQHYFLAGRKNVFVAYLETDL